MIDEKLITILRKVVLFDDNDPLEKQLVGEIKELFENESNRLEKLVSPQPCNHILAFEEGVDESWLNYLGDHRKIGKDYEEYGVKFNYCPICGEKLSG